MPRPTVRSAAAVAVMLPGVATAARVPPDVRDDLARIHAEHGSPVLLVTADGDVLKTMGRWLVRDQQPHIVRRMPAIGTRSYELQIALDRADLRCGVEVSATWRLERFGDCSSWEGGPVVLSTAVPTKQPATERGRKFERVASIAIGPAMSTGTVVDISAEGRMSRKDSVAFAYTTIQVREWGSPALLAAQARRYVIGDFDRGIYGLAQVGMLSAELGEVRSPGAAVGIGIKYTTKPGLMADAYIGAGPAVPERIHEILPVGIHPAVGGRVGWAF